MAPKTGSGFGNARAGARSTPPIRRDRGADKERDPPADSLDLTSFISALEQEIGDLHSTIKTRRDDRVEKAFQRVPRNMRRRTASHNAKRVPRRLRQQAHRDQAADNTPSIATGLAKRKKARPASAWVHENTKKRIKVQEERKLARQEGGDDMEEEEDGDEEEDNQSPGLPRAPLPIKNLHLPTHRWQSKRAQMDNPGFLWNTTLVRTPANKTYRMSLRAAGLKPGMCTCWDTSYKPTIFLKGPAKQLDEALAIVVEPHLLTPSLRSGASCVDVKLPRSFNYQTHQNQAVDKGFELSGPGNCGAMTLFYNPITTISETTTEMTDGDNDERSAFLRVHPTLFSHIWTTLNNEISRKQLSVAIRDFRLEIGSIDVTGSAAVETLAATLYPYETTTTPMEPQGREFLKLRSIDTTGLATSSGAMLAFNIQDPRLDEPQTTPGVEGNSQGRGPSPTGRSLHSILLDWPSNDIERRPSGLFDTMPRHSAKKLVPQTTLDKRRGKLSTNERLLLTSNPECRPIPVIVASADGASSVPAAADPHASSRSTTSSPTWTIIAPRACIDAIWQRMHLQHLSSSGQRPMHAGLEEEMHMSLERGKPWFPADFPGTPTGWDWELQSRRRQEQIWNAKPTAKRTQWKAVDLGNGAPTKGELGSGFACDWEFLFGVDTVPGTLANVETEKASEVSEKSGLLLPASQHVLAEDTVMDVCDEAEGKKLRELVQFKALQPNSSSMPAIVRDLQHVTWRDVRNAVHNMRLHKPVVWRSPYSLMTISVQLIKGGVPSPRARVYRLPTDCNRTKWIEMAHRPECKHKEDQKKTRPPMPRRMPADADIATRKKLLAQSLLETPLPYPRPQPEDTNDIHLPIPGRDDLIGFLTSGALRFLTSKGAGIGHVSAQKLVESILAGDGSDSDAGITADDSQDRRMPISRDARLCIVRNAGERVGHLARWTPISN